MKLKENQAQWIAIMLTVLGLFMTAFYNSRTLEVAQIENELISHLNLSERYHQLLFSLIQNDPKVFSKADDASLEENKYLIYEAIDLFCTVHSLNKYQKEMVGDIWPQWSKRMEFFFSKPAVRFAWYSQKGVAENIYNKDFIDHVNQIIEENGNV